MSLAVVWRHTSGSKYDVMFACCGCTCLARDVIERLSQLDGLWPCDTWALTH